LEKKIGVAIVAAGAGTRMGASMPKQYMEIEGEPIVFKSLWAFASCPRVDEIALVVDEDHIEYCLKYIEPRHEKLNGKKVSMVQGGSTRYYSAMKGIMALDEAEYVMIHDGARPFVSQEVIDNVIDRALEVGSAVACVIPKNTIRTEKRTLNRGELFEVQTPQCFRREEILDAYRKGVEEGFRGTDDASFAERAGIRIGIAEGSYENIKITTKEDLPVETRIGKGFDVHKFKNETDGAGTGEKTIVLGGVSIPFDKELEAHSDGDVLLHSVMDALLGAAGLGDIGKLFPDSDPDFKDISSMELLGVVAILLRRGGFTPGNIDVTLIGQEPKIAPYSDAIRENISIILSMPKEKINIKGTTTEGLGFTGRGEGLACEAICSLIK
jgi:2-C-methyl-D-erythritol 4-phosphate cytidylyltransferase/2-C-methyl-D-erythritol 2,4-cyclodiphosphate synthase